MLNYCLYLIVYSFVISLTDASLPYKDEVATGGRQGNPGIQMTISQRGIDYFNKVLGDTLNAALPRLPIPDATTQVPLGSIDLTNLHSINFKPADSYNIELRSPNRVIWSMHNMDVGVKGHAKGHVGGIHGEGNFDFTGYGANMQMEAVVTNDNGKPRFKITDCSARTRTLDVNLYDFSTKIMRLFENHRKLVMKYMKPKMESELCKRFRKFLGNDFNDQLQKMPMKMSLNKQQYSLLDGTPFGSSSSSTVYKQGTSKTEIQLREVLSKLLLDYSLMRDPQLSPGEADIYSKGEVSYMGQGNTPFFPGDISDGSSKSSRMLYVTMSDYTLNSMFYHAYQNRLLNFKINKNDNPDFSSLFRPSCNEMMGEVCLGSALPELFKQYPDYLIEIRIDPSQAPAVIAKTDKLAASMEGEMRILAKKGSENIEVLKIFTVFQTDLKPSLENNMMKGTMEVTKMEAKLLQTTLPGMTQNKLDTMAKMSKIVIEALGNSQLSKGFPLPTVEEGTLVNPKIRILDRKVILETDIDVNRDAMVRLTEKMVSKSAGRSFSSPSSSRRGHREKRRGNRRQT